MPRWILAVALLTMPAFAHQITTPSGIVQDYTNLHGPPSGGGLLCCNNKDCRPVPDEDVSFEDGEIWLMVDGLRFRAMDPRWYLPNQISADGGWHACKLPADLYQLRCSFGPLQGL